MHIPSIRYGRRVTQNFNKLIGRYPGATVSRPASICASAQSVASATRNGKRLIAVVLGSSSGQARAVRAAQLLERGFGGNGWLAEARLRPPSQSGSDRCDAAEPARGDVRASASGRPPTRTPTSSPPTAAHRPGETPVTFFTAGLQPPMGNRRR